MIAVPNYLYDQLQSALHGATVSAAQDSALHARLRAASTALTQAKADSLAAELARPGRMSGRPPTDQHLPAAAALLPAMAEVAVTEAVQDWHNLQHTDSRPEVEGGPRAYRIVRADGSPAGNPGGRSGCSLLTRSEAGAIAGRLNRPDALTTHQPYTIERMPSCPM